MTTTNPEKLPSHLALELIRQIDPHGIGRQALDPAVRAHILDALTPLDALQAQAIVAAVKDAAGVAPPAAMPGPVEMMQQLADAMSGGNDEAEPIAPGDVVVLAGGGVAMTVEGVGAEADPYVDCRWFVGTELRDEPIRASALLKVSRR